MHSKHENVTGKAIQVENEMHSNHKNYNKDQRSGFCGLIRSLVL